MYQKIRTDEMYKKAERMHLKAIQIRESLSGTEDYLVKIWAKLFTTFIIFLQVADSLRYLAALYYDMEEYGKAEELTLRSIRIKRKLFGPIYSGLGSNYFLLIKVGRLICFLEWNECSCKMMLDSQKYFY